MATARARFQAHVDGLNAGDATTQIGWLLSAASGQHDIMTLASGDNTITPPALTTLIAVIPPTTTSATIRVKQSGDAGSVGSIQMAGQPFILASGSTAQIFNASAQIIGVELIFL